MTLLRMLAFQPGGSAGKAASGNPKPVARKSAAPANVKKQVASAPVPNPVSQEWQEPDWASLVPQLDLSGLNKQLASNCAYLRREGTTVLFRLDGRSESYLTKARQDSLASALSEYFGETLKVEIAVGPAAAYGERGRNAQLQAVTANRRRPAGSPPAPGSGSSAGISEPFPPSDAQPMH